jgi:hypothetical protein
MPRAKRAPSNTVQSLVDAHRAVAAGDIEPPDHVFLRDRDRPHWLNVVRARARNEWTATDLVIAANLARAFADVERLSQELEDEDDIVYSTRGTPVPNPKYAILQQLAQRISSLTRILQMQPATTGTARDKVKGRKVEDDARRAKQEVAEEQDDLIPTA